MAGRQLRCILAVVMVWLAGVVAATEYACNFDKDASLKSMAFCNTSLADEVRVKDLVSQLTLGEKVSQLVNTAEAIPRLGIPAYEWWQEGLHGVAHVPFGGALPRATSFPLPILTTASFNKELWNQIGQAVSTEARAFYNEGLAGLTYWSPVINIARDPRWGRIQETSGEDPATTSAYAAAFVRGLQEDDGSPASKRIKLSACCKHFTAYDIDNWEGVDRYHFDAQVTEQDLADTYNPPFRSCVQEGRSTSLMCSYNRVNGVPACANHDFLVNTVRNTWGLQGYIVSDCDSVLVMHESTNYSPTTEDAAADALNAGLDLNCGDYLASYTEGAIRLGKVSQDRVDNAVSNLFSLRMRLGMFDFPPSSQPFASLDASSVCTPAHQELSLEAARQGIVLLKNDFHTLPLPHTQTLDAQTLNLAVIGPHANASHDMLGNYEGIPCKYITPLQALSGFTTTQYSPGCFSIACDDKDLIPSAVETASHADAVILVMGLSQEQESEKLDRTSLRLPGYQEQLITECAALGKPVILVLMSGGPVDVGFAKASPGIQSILWAGYPGEAGGQAIADVVFGEHNPGGKLPMSWYYEDYTKISMTNMGMRPDAESQYPGRTYRFFTGEMVYAFGDGMGYSEFEHEFVVAPRVLTRPEVEGQMCDPQQMHTRTDGCSTAKQDMCALASFDVHVNVRNVGALGGHHTVLLFWTPPYAGEYGAPLKELTAFESVFVEAGAVEKVVLRLNQCRHLGFTTGDGTRIVQVGEHILSVGDAVHSLFVLENPADTLDVAAGGH